jgi:cell division transport system permease protein
MGKLRHWLYYFKHAFSSILGNRLIYLISTGTISISLLLFGTFVLISANFSNWVQSWEKSLSLSVYLENGMDDRQKEEVERAIQRLPGAQIKEFISKDRAMRDLAETLGSQAGLLEGLSKNPLPASYEVVFRNGDLSREELKQIKASLEKVKGVEEVQYSEQWLEQVEGFVYITRILGLVVGGLLCVAVLFIVTNTIKLAIYSRRDEIEIYKLVGATDWFVKTPFLIEGAIQGILGAGVALSVLFMAYSLLTVRTIQLFGLPVMDVIFLNTGQQALIVFLGLVLGLLGSFVAIGRFFKF